MFIYPYIFCLAISDIKMEVEYGGFAGNTLEITCTITGPSLPSFEWRNGSMILSLSARVKIENNDKVSKLFVRKTAKSDSGYYHCIARLVLFIFSLDLKSAPEQLKNNQNLTV